MVDDLVEPEYIRELIWLSEEGKQALPVKAGKLTREGFPETAQKMKHTIDTLLKESMTQKHQF